MRKQSVFVMLRTSEYPTLGSLFEVKLDDVGNSNTSPPSPLEPLANFLLEHMDEPVHWGSCSLGSQLCLFAHTSIESKEKSLTEYHFNVKTMEWNVIKPPNSPKYYGTVVSAYGKIYYIVDPYFSADAEEPSFERYDLKKCTWEPLKPFPYSLGHHETSIKGYAVGCGLILYSIFYSYATDIGVPRTKEDTVYKMWAYDVNKDVWLQVKVEDPDCYRFIGSAVSANGTIYGLSHRVEVMELSITRQQSTDEGHSVTCSLKSRAILPDSLFHTRVSPSATRFLSLDMVHLGDLNFCLIEFDTVLGGFSQFLKLTRIQLVGQATMEIKIGCSNLYEVPYEYGTCIEHSFTLDCKDIEEEEEEEEIAIPIDRRKAVVCHFKPEYDYVEADWRENEKKGYDSSVHVQDEVGIASASSLAEAMDLKTALRLVLRNSLAHEGLIRGVMDISKAISNSVAEFCVLADDCGRGIHYRITALCKHYKVKLLTVPSAKTLGDWCVGCKTDYEGEANKVVCAAVKAFGEEESYAVCVVQEYLKHVEPGKPCALPVIRGRKKRPPCSPRSLKVHSSWKALPKVPCDCVGHVPCLKSGYI